MESICLLAFLQTLNAKMFVDLGEKNLNKVPLENVTMGSHGKTKLWPLTDIVYVAASAVPRCILTADLLH